MEVLTKNAKETQKLAESLAKELLVWPAPGKGALVVGLRGELGAGKTTFSQGFAKGLRVKEPVKSPTFVILKSYKLKAKSCFKYFYHIDCYRLKSAKDARSLMLPEIFKNPENLILIEWPERVEKVLPKRLINVYFSSINETTRKIGFN